MDTITNGNGNALFLRPTEVARQLAMSRAKVYAMISSGELPATRFGKRGVRIPRAAIEKLVADTMAVADTR
jgi:excisionase family DNA binding protein